MFYPSLLSLQSICVYLELIYCHFAVVLSIVALRFSGGRFSGVSAGRVIVWLVVDWLSLCTIDCLSRPSPQHFESNLFDNWSCRRCIRTTSAGRKIGRTH